MKLKEENESLKINIHGLELAAGRQGKFVEELQGDIRSLESLIKTKESELNGTKRELQESSIINKDYSEQVDKQFGDIRKHFERAEFEYKNKIDLLEKQIRIRRAQLNQFKAETAAEMKIVEQSRANAEKLLHQEQVMHKTAREEIKLAQAPDILNLLFFFLGSNRIDGTTFTFLKI